MFVLKYMACKLLTDTTIKTIDNKYPCQLVLDKTIKYYFKYLCKLLTDKTISTISNKYPCQVVLDKPSPNAMESMGRTEECQSDSPSR